MNHLVFLAGASGNTQFWNPLVAKLPEAYTKQIIHYPGFHGVAADPEINNFDDLSNYVVAQIQQPSILIAQSMGGIFAMLRPYRKLIWLKVSY
jgi:surfactin synthase thioesterase subunit